MQTDTSPRKVALITGAARRIGATIARTLHGAGYDLALHYLSSENDMQALRLELLSARADSVITLQADLADTAVPSKIVKETLNRYGRLDAVINNASAYYATSLDSITLEKWHHLMTVNASAPFFLCLAAASPLRKSHGAVINITDIYAERPLPGYAVYSISKATLSMITKVLATELGPEVRVNAIAPGNILWSTNAIKAETLTLVEDRTALNRQGSPDDIAEGVLYLLQNAKYCTGTTLTIDGGRLLHI